MVWNDYHIYVLYYMIINGITGTIFTLIWLPLMKIMKRKGRIRTVYVLLKCAMAGYIFPIAFVIYYMLNLITGYEVSSRWLYTDNIYFIVTILFILWLAGFLIKGAQFVISCVQMKRYRQARYLPSADEKETLMRIKKRLGIRRNIRLYHGYKVLSPFSTNFIRPVIYLRPREYDPKELEIVLTHELYHIKYWDIFWKPVFALYACIYWFYPLVSVIARQYSKWTEANCDNHCYEDHFEEKDYFMVIMNTLIENLNYVNTLASNWCENETETVWRMELMQESKNKNWKAELSIVTIVLVVVISIIGTVFSEYGAEQLYTAVVTDTQKISLISNEQYRLSDDWNDYTKENYLRQIPASENIRQSFVDKDGVQYLMGQIDTSEIKAETVIRSDTFIGKADDSITMVLYTDSEDSNLEMGIVSASGNSISIMASDSLTKNLIIPEDGEYAVFIQNTGDEPVNIYGAYSITPAEALSQ